MKNKKCISNSNTQASSPLGVSGMFHGASNLIFENARALRNNQTETELILWNILKNYKQNGFKFRRQHPISNYIADFYCHKAKLIIEIDGEYHNNKEQIIRDKERTAFFLNIGLKEIRFSNQQVLFEIENVLNEIDNIIGLKNEK
jgi:very-short-patch-repair endonuclease